MYLELEFSKTDCKFKLRTPKNLSNQFELEENRSDWSLTGWSKVGAEPVNGLSGLYMWRMSRCGRSGCNVETSPLDENDVSFVTLKNDVVLVKTTCHFVDPEGNDLSFQRRMTETGGDKMRCRLVDWGNKITCRFCSSSS